MCSKRNMSTVQAGTLDNYRERNFICSGSTLVAIMTSETRRPGDLKVWHWLATVVFPLYGSRQGQGLPSPPVVVTRVSLSSRNNAILKVEMAEAGRI